MHQIQCSEVWGGIKNEDVDACSRCVTISLYSSACDGGKGGDIYYVSVCAADAVTRIAIADVVGHGAQVSNVSQWLYESLRSHMSSPSGDCVLKDLNDLAIERGAEALTTASVIALCKPAESLFVSYAGHLPAMLRRRDDGRWTALPIERVDDSLRNLPLGIEPGIQFDERQVRAQSGDRILLYTDGVTETPNSKGQLFGQERLEDVLSDVGDASPYELKTAVLSELRRFSGGELRHDDVTLLAAEIA